MIDRDVSLNPNPLAQFIGKPTADFTKSDLIKFIEEKGIEMIDFRYVGQDGKLKSLNFVINSRKHLDSILSTGERVDGSSLFSHIEAESSDLYVIPRFKTAFVNPFSEYPTLDLLCSFYTQDGLPLESAPEQILRKAVATFHNSTGFDFKAMFELEYYVVGGVDLKYPSIDQKGYNASPPFSNYANIRKQAMKLISQCGGQIKYGHSEVGNFVRGDEYFEQHEIEFLPVNPMDAVDQLVIAKWILRMLGNKHGVVVSFAPKITVGKAGSGLHIHMLLERDGKNAMVDGRQLSSTAKKVIAGILDLAAPLTAFGNTIPTSYLRLVPHQEAPTKICWGKRNRSVLIRVPLGWRSGTNMSQDANPKEKTDSQDVSGKQTIELRSGDGSADLYHFMAGIILAAQHGLVMENSLEIAEKLYVDVDIFSEKNKEKRDQLEDLPKSCWESAQVLNAQRVYFEKSGTFPAGTIDQVISILESYDDNGLSERLYGKEEELKKLVMELFHCK